MAMTPCVAVVFMFLSADAVLLSNGPAPVQALEGEIEQVNELVRGGSTATDEEAKKIADGITLVSDRKMLPNGTAGKTADTNLTGDVPPKQTAHAITNAGGLEMTSGQMEAAITDLMIGQAKLGATPLGDSVNKISNIIVNTMMPKVKAAHNSDQRRLYKLKKDIEQCGKNKISGIRIANTELSKYQKQSGYHKKCRSDEAVKSASKTNCLTEEKAKHTVKVLKCKAFAAASQKWGTSKSNGVIVRKAGGESVESYIKRLSLTFCGKHVHGTKGKKSLPGGWGGGLLDGALDQYLKAKDGCTGATKEWKSKMKECKRKTHDYNTQKAKCNQFQDLMDGASCKRATLVKDTCESYAGCYFAKKKAYQDFAAKVAFDEMDRKAEWRGLKRIECIISAFKDKKVTNEEIDACKKKTHSTEYFNIKYPCDSKFIKSCSLQKCVIPTRYPSTSTYLKAEFAPLPALAKGKPSQACNGVMEVDVKPYAGSPRGCKCTRVITNGPYTAGALLKCTSCKDVRRSSERSSCPQGTKIFAPASRTDWKTFLASATPLRSPNWIIDVTRPKNGCGGCTGNPMNSGNARQKTWSTTDGAPWWLRSSRYNEPNGDYSASCYLDLWRTPQNENGITFNDGRCNYHAKSYYCQPTKMNLQPAPGSPKSCKCSKVQLAGTYSPGDLVKCEQCITVYRSSQKNSCPSGMKIFAPRSRADWRTFFNSAGPLRSPHWIIDITRPQNGCGGCTRYSMKSSTPQQASWRTSDAAAWWLRNSRYNEPNGDYTANCFMDLWKNPNHENNIKFNDWRCNYRSRSYYCQPIVLKELRPKPLPPAPRLLVPWNNLQTGLLMKVFHFRQGGRCPNLNGRSPNIVKKVASVNYPTTSKVWPGLTQKDDFAIRWDGILYVRNFAKSYTFYIDSDDGSKLYIDGSLRVNNDGLHGMRGRTGKCRLKGTQSRVFLTMFERGGHAGMVFKYSGADTNNKVKVVGGNTLRFKQDKGWQERVYDTPKNLKNVPNFDSLTPVRTRTVSQVRYTNTGGNWPGFGRRDDFGARWTGKITITRSGTYRFQLSSDDGSLLYVDNKLVVNNNGLHGLRGRTGDIKMKSGKATLKAEFFERGGHAGMYIYYMGSDTNNRLVLVPSSVMEADV
jgi:hypothetical protein